MPKTNLFRWSFLGVFSILLILQLAGLFFFDIVRVSEREVAVITRLGKVTDIDSAGWHLKIPWIDRNAAIYDLGVQSSTAEASAATRDQQSVKINTNVQYRLDGSKAKEIYQLVKDQKYLNESIIPPFIQESIKAISTKYTAGELLEKRDVVKSDIEAALQNRLREYYSNVVAVNIVNIDWSDGFDKAVEQKVIAEQDALRKKQELEQAKIQAEIDVTKAKGEADATEIRGKALKQNPETLEKAKIDKWDGKLPQVEGTSSPIIDLTKK